MNIKRLVCSTILGMCFGIICILGTPLTVPNRVFLPSLEIYLIGAWYNRFIMGIVIGFAGDLKIYKEKDNILNSIIRGALIGAIVSTSFAFLRNYPAILFFIVGIIFGILNDLISTKYTQIKE
ncbi:MAG: hypothetical protein ACFFAO_08125 [Candidatus Hermodarchaeota archaeon]